MENLTSSRHDQVERILHSPTSANEFVWHHGSMLLHHLIVGLFVGGSHEFIGTLGTIPLGVLVVSSAEQSFFCR